MVSAQNGSLILSKSQGLLCFTPLMQEVSEPYLSVIERGLRSGLGCGSFEFIDWYGYQRIGTKSIYLAEMVIAPNRLS